MPPSTVEGVGVRACARVVVHPAVPVLGDDGVLGFAVVRVLALVLPVAPEPDHGLRVAHVAVLLLPRVARVQIPLEVFGVAHDAVPVVLFVWQGAQRAVVEVVSWRAVVECEWLGSARLATDVREPVGWQRAAAAAAASRALRPPAGALAAGHEEHARRGVKL